MLVSIRLKAIVLFGLILMLAASCRQQGNEVIEPQIPVEKPKIENIEGSIRFLEQAPRSVELDELVSDTLMFMFAERQAHILTQNVVVDLSLQCISIASE